MTYLVIKALGIVLPADVASMLWAFFFIVGLALAYLVNWSMARLQISHLVDSGLQRRITGWSVDFLIVATIMAIQLTIVWQYLLPIGVMSIIGGVVTTAVTVYLGNRLWSYNLERTAAVYGAVTGTVSCGLLLLRIVDPEFKTPVSIEIAIMNVFSIPLIGLCTVLVNGPIWWQWPLWLMVVIFSAIMLIAFGLIKIFNLCGAPKN
jgi:ESS family glutamate:Na+ symporter